MGEVGLVKGASFIRRCELVHGLVERGVLCRDALEVRLSADALHLLERKIEPSLWYPIDAVDELSRLLVDFEGDGRPEYMRELGARALDALLERETFRGFIDGAMRRKGSEGQTLVQMAGLIYSFGRWSYEGRDLVDFSVTLSEAGQLPELARETIAGFMQALVWHTTGRRIDVQTNRPERERVIFRVTPAAAAADREA